MKPISNLKWNLFLPAFNALSYLYKGSFNNYVDKMSGEHSIANSSLFPTFMYLHSNSTQMLALKKPGFFTFSGSKN